MSEELENNKSWDDDVLKGIRYAQGLLNYMAAERSQLYGSLIGAMLELRNAYDYETELELVITKEQLDEFGKEYYILFQPVQNSENDATGLKIVLKKQNE